MTKQAETEAPEKVGRRERRRVETRERLFRAAMALFAKRGFFETTTEDITDAADVGQGTFFNYFPSKQHVLTALFEIQVGKIEASLHEAQAGRTSVEDALRELIQRIGEEPGRTPALTRSLIVAFLSSDAARAGAIDMLARGRRALSTMIVLGQKSGEIRRDRKASDLALAFQKRVMGTLFYFALQEKCDLAAELDTAFSHFWAEA